MLQPLFAIGNLGDGFQLPVKSQNFKFYEYLILFNFLEIGTFYVLRVRFLQQINATYSN
jgi:hypothetical protein